MVDNIILHNNMYYAVITGLVRLLKIVMRYAKCNSSVQIIKITYKTASHVS